MVKICTSFPQIFQFLVISLLRKVCRNFGTEYDADMELESETKHNARNLTTLKKSNSDATIKHVYVDYG